MAHASKHTRTETRTVTEEVTTYTLELSEAEREAVLAAIQRDGSPLRALDTVYEALTNAAATDRPLAVGDRVRVVRVYPHGDVLSAREGSVGELLSIDLRDATMPYEVDTDTAGSMWVHSVERAS